MAGNTKTVSVSSDIDGTVSGSYNLIGTGGSGGLNGYDSNHVLTAASPLLGARSAITAARPRRSPCSPGSPAIGAGTATDAPTTDQRGISRTQSAGYDIGAFESQGFTITVTAGNNQTADTGTAFADALEVTVASSYDEPVVGGRGDVDGPGLGGVGDVHVADRHDRGRRPGVGDGDGQRHGGHVQHHGDGHWASPRPPRFR